MDPSAVSPLGFGARGEYYDHLRSIQRRNFEGKTFYHQPHVTSWMLEKASNTSSSNAERLVKEVYAHDPNSFPPQEVDNLLLFSVLLHEKLQCGHMYRTFQSHLPQSFFIQLEDLSKHCERIRSDLENSRPRLPPGRGYSNYSEVIETFERLRWSFVPFRLQLNMNPTISHASIILPFCYREVINDKGGTATVCLHGIQEDLVEDTGLRKALEPSRISNKEYGNCYELAVKSYIGQMKLIYEVESQAFQGVRDQQGVVQYLGEYRLQHPAIHFPNFPSHHIMLEYGEMDLDEYLADTYPPVLNEEIRGFWEELFSVAKTLDRIHHLQYDSRDGNRQGWHGDIKPDNILRVRGKYKLADFGFAKFEREREGNTTTFLLGGTRTYGAPECDQNRNGTRTPLSQTIDTWSFGCVLSSVATWVVLGSQAYENYNERRTIAIKALKAGKAKGTVTRAPSCENAFHDGRNVLPAVTEWHVYLRNSARRADTTTHRVLDLVDHYMLLSKPEDRLTMGQLCERLKEIILLSKQDFQQKLDNNDLKTIRPETLSALRELDNQAPLKAAVAQEARAEVDVRGRGGHGDPSQTETADDKAERPNKLRKSERFDKIVFAKTANRAQNSQPLPEVTESPTQLPVVTRLGSAVPAPRHGHQQAKIPDIRLDSSGSPPVQEPSPTWPSHEEPPDVAPYKTTSPESLSPGFSDSVSSRQLQSPDQDPLTLDHRGESVQPPPTASHESSRVMRPNTFELPESTAAGASARISGQSDGREITYNHPAEEISIAGRALGHERNVQAPLFALRGSDPELRKTAILHELDAQNRVWGDQKKSWKRFLQGVPQDERLKGFISNRDVVFVVDNAYSMLPHWDAVKTTLLALAMKIGPLDKDGLDLIYTCGDSNNVKEAKGWDIPKLFGKSIEDARLNMDQHDRTNIEETLTKCFDSHSASAMSQKQTLIVLTDGLWEGSMDWNSAEKEIARYVNSLRRNLKRLEKRWFTIQFISYGQNQKALERLQELDDNLHDDNGEIVEDIVDTKPWYFGDVESLILGSIHGAADIKKASDVGATDKSQLSVAGVRNPSPAPSLTVRDLGRKASNRVSKFSKFLGKDS